MGIQGLSTLVESEPNLFFKTIKLHDRLLVVDGNCVSCWLYRRHCRNSCFNGDYKDFEHCVEIFFTRLKQSNIFPIVILDGAHEARKLKTVKERMEDRITLAGRIKTTQSRNELLTPVLLTDVFKNTLSRMKIVLCQSISEADLEITRVAQLFNCPVLSFDSDFYLDDVEYIPFSTLNQELFELADSEKSTPDSKYFVYGKQFDRSSFFDKFGGLPNMFFLPFLSFLLGNDYSDAKNYESFFHRLSAQKSPLKLQQKISLLCKWFRKTGSLEDAVDEFLEQLRSELRKKTRKELMRCMDEKNNNESSYLVQYLKHSILSSPGFPPAEYFNITNSTLAKECSNWMNELSSFLSSNRFNPASRVKMKIPEWLLAEYVQGKAPRILMDLLLSQNLFFLVQVESQSLSSLNSSAIEILRSILGIFYCSCPKRNLLCVNVYSRVGNRMVKQFLVPTFPETDIAISEIPNLCLLDRANIILDVLGVDRKYLSLVPDDWKLFILVLANWCKADKSPLTLTALGCIIFSSLFLSIVDRRVGFIGEKVVSYTNDLKPTEEPFHEKCPDEREQETEQSKMESSSENVISAILSITDGDCLLAAKNFSYLCSRSSTSDKIPEKLVKPILHCFAQFQTNLMVIELLNAILTFPFLSVNVANFYHGTLAYSIYFEIKEHNSLEQFIRVRFEKTPTLQAFFLSVLRLLEKLIACDILTPNELQIRKPNVSGSSKKSKKGKNNRGRKKS